MGDGGAVHAVDVALYTEGGESVLDVARVELRGYKMSNAETRRGRIEVEATLASLQLLDMTPQAGDKYNQVPVPPLASAPPSSALTRPGVERGQAVCLVPGSMKEGGGGGVAWCKYVHFGRGEAAATEGSLAVSLAKVKAVAAPRFIAEVPSTLPRPLTQTREAEVCGAGAQVVMFVQRSAVFRSNFAALSKVLSGTARFRQRLVSPLPCFLSLSPLPHATRPLT